MTRHQKPGDAGLDRTDHIWIKRDQMYLCCLCGAVIRNGMPPPYPTPKKWMPDTYLPLLEIERDLVKYEEKPCGK